MYTVYIYVYIDSNILWRSYMESHGNVECAFATRARIKLFVLASVFIANVPLGKGVCTQSLFICCSGIVVIRHIGSRL